MSTSAPAPPPSPSTPHRRVRLRDLSADPSNDELAARATPDGPRPDLSGRVVLVTGAGMGLGRATAEAAARAGATVVLLGRTPRKLETVYDRIVEAGGPAPVLLPFHLTNAPWTAYEELAELLARELGRLDALVHCAARFTGFTLLAEVPPKDWMDGLQTNLTAAYTLTRTCLPLLEASDAGRVVFVTDTVPKAYQGVYGVTKAAVEAMAAIWATEYRARGTPAFAVFNPGPMRTGLRRRGYPGEDIQAVPPPEVAAAELLRRLDPAPTPAAPPSNP